LLTVTSLTLNLCVLHAHIFHTVLLKIVKIFVNYTIVFEKLKVIITFTTKWIFDQITLFTATT